MSYEQLAIALDRNFGQLLWEDSPEVANQVFAELMGRILDLDVEFCGTIESEMVVTIFQYSTFFLRQGWYVNCTCMYVVTLSHNIRMLHIHTYILVYRKEVDCLFFWPL